MPRPRKAWLLPARCRGADLGIDKDLADLQRMFTDDLHPEHRAAVEVVCSDGRLLTSEVIRSVLDDIRTFDGDRFVWVGAHGIRRGLGTPFIQTDDPDGGHITVDAFWRALLDIAQNSRGLLMVVLDVCHAGLSAGAPLIARLEANLIGLAASGRDSTARGTSTEGGWLTQRLIRALTAPTDRPADGRVTVGAALTAMKQARLTENRGGQTPFIVGMNTFSVETLNRLSSVAPTRPAASTDPLAAWRAYTRTQHSRLNKLFDEGDSDRARVYVELTLTRDDPKRQRADAIDDAPQGADDTADPTRHGIGDAMPGAVTLGELMARRHSGRWRVLGEPGAGKSTIARRLAFELARDPGRPVPVYLPLAALAVDGVHPFEAAETALKTARGVRAANGLADALHDAAAEGRVWLLLDGLDEVDTTHAADLREHIRAWADSLELTPIAVLGRPFDERPLPGYESARVLPLGRGQQHDLLTGWLGESRAGLIEREINARPRLAELARNPLMLSLMALLVDRGKPLGGSRRALYHDALDALLEQPERYGKPIKLADTEAARRLLQAVSVALHQEGAETWTAEVIRDEIEAAVAVGEAEERHLQVFGSAKAFLAELPRCGGVLGPFGGHDGAWRYLHRSLREFLAAEHLSRRPSRLEALLTEIAETQTPDHWGVVLGLACALADTPEARAGRLDRVRVASRSLALWALPEVELPPEEGLLALEAIIDSTESARHGEDYRRLMQSWADLEAGQAAVAARVSPEAPIERLAALHYAMRAAGIAWSDDDFFATAQRPMPEPEALVDVPGGAFMMGSPLGELGRVHDEMLHSVTLSPFALGATPVTRAEYARFDPGYQCHGSDAHPVTGLSWYAARLYAAWAGCRLPSEAEWEYACRAGTTTRFWSGNHESQLAQVGWYMENAHGQVRSVGAKPANPFGLHDMHGNVWEWCADWHGPYEPADHHDPLGPPAGKARVYRGGSVWLAPRRARSAYRGRSGPGFGNGLLGFRLARDIRALERSSGRTAVTAPPTANQ